MHVDSRCVEIPRAGLEPVRRRGERADRTDLHGVAREVRDERLVGERHHLGVVAPADEVDQLVAGHLVGEAGAAIAQNAPFAVEVDQVADRDRLLVVTLLFDEARLARAVAECLVLQRALAPLVADGAVERVVGEQQLEHALLGLLRPAGCRCGRPGRRRPGSCTTPPSSGRAGLRPRPCTGGTCRPATCAGGSRSEGRTRRLRAQQRSPCRPCAPVPHDH